MSCWDDILRESVGQTEFQEHAEIPFLTSSFTFRNAQAAADMFAAHGRGYIYSRFSNPTVATLNRRIALMEGAECALSTASGMAAILMTVMGICRSGDRIVCGENVFGSTIQLLSNIIAKFGVNIEYVADTTIDSWRRAACIDDCTALMLLETPSNPMHEVADISALAEVAAQAGAVLAVDNCLLAGIQRPLALGADLVIHSGTKYLDGQGRVLGGIVAGGESLLMDKLYPFLRTAGPAISPFNAWVLLKSMETLPLRMQQHAESALLLARWLEAQSSVRRVWYSGLPSHPAHELAMRQQSNVGGGLITFAVCGGREAAWRFIDALQCFSITANFGDTKSIVTHPATTTHSRLAPEVRARLGICDDVIRLSIGLESPAVLQADMAQAFAVL